MKNPLHIATALLLLLFALPFARAETRSTKIASSDYGNDMKLFIRAVLDHTEPGWRTNSNGLQKSGLELMEIELNAINHWTIGVPVGGRKTRAIKDGRATFFSVDRSNCYMVIEREYPDLPTQASRCRACDGTGIYEVTVSKIVDGKIIPQEVTRSKCRECNGSGRSRD